MPLQIHSVGVAAEMADHGVAWAQPGAACSSITSSVTGSSTSAARGALEARAGRKLGDLEWDQERSRLLSWVLILRAWDRNGAMQVAAVPQAA